MAVRCCGASADTSPEENDMSKIPNGRAAGAMAMALGTTAIMAIGANAASATTVLGGGSPLASGTAIAAPLTGTATVALSTGATITCTTGGLGGTLGTNPATAVAFSPTTFNLAGCTDTAAGIDFTSATLTVPGTGSVTSAAGGGRLDIANATIGFRVRLGGAPGVCNYTVSNATRTASGAVSNTDSSVSFTNVPLTAGGICGSFTPAALSATFAPATASGALVTVAP
jgi:hypothetical protein